MNNKKERKLKLLGKRGQAMLEAFGKATSKAVNDSWDRGFKVYTKVGGKWMHVSREEYYEAKAREDKER